MMRVDIKVTVKVADIIGSLKKNKEAHVAEYTAAVEAYFVKLGDAINKLRKKAASKDFEANYSLHLAKPVLNEKQYDEYINMLTLSQQETMEIDTHQYRCFFEDQWDWALAAKALNSTYASGF